MPELSPGSPPGSMSGTTSGSSAASIRDVARLVGVSHTTVSRVLNRHPNVSAATRERVESAIAELGFRPSRTARALALNSSRVIGVLDATGGRLHGPASTIAAIEDAARARGYSVMIAWLDPGDPESVESAIEHLLDQGAVGLIMVGPVARARELVADAAPSVPFVAMHPAEAENAASLDQEAGGRIAARHLLGLGHRVIAHLAGPPEWLEAESRQSGFVAELAVAGLAPAAIERGDWSAESGYAAGIRLLAGSPPAGLRGLTAVFCANDQMALGVLHAARDAGVEVPRRLSVIGFDDAPESAHYAPALTTVRQDFGRLGTRAVANLLEELGEPPGGTGTVPEPWLIVRDSTAPAP